MFYILGSGRCGTKTIAHCLGGVHEPLPRIEEDATNFYRARLNALPRLVEKLKTRAAIDTPAISDYKQSFVIPIIREVDPEAEFVVLVRDPTNSILSFIRRRWYRRGSNKQADRVRLRPSTEFPEAWTHVMKNAWLWMETYRVIFSTLGTTGYWLLYTEELGDTVLNAGKIATPLTLTGPESAFFDEHVLPFWEQIRWLKREHHHDDWREVQSWFLPLQQRIQARKDFRRRKGSGTFSGGNGSQETQPNK